MSSGRCGGSSRAALWTKLQASSLVPKNTTPAGGGDPAGVVFVDGSPGGGEEPAYSSSPGRRSALTKFLSPVFEGRNLLREQRPPREEVRRAPFRWPAIGRR